MIEVKNLTKTFKQKNGETFNAVDNVSFEVNKGEIVVLLGVNGAGKTTTMRMLSTVLKPNSGTVVIEGYDTLLQPQSVRANLGFLSGDTGLYARLTGREIITYFGRLYDVDDKTIKNRIDYLSELLDMNDFLDKKSDMLSTGMKQKISIARSIIHDPPVMIFDEPTSGLDILTAKNIIDFIYKCKEDGKCVLFSTHIMREAERIADKIVLIHKGTVLAEGDWGKLQEQTGKRDLDDIFIHFVEQQKEAQGATDEL
jgi:sodium transport system ATP-binding protein